MDLHQLILLLKRRWVSWAATTLVAVTASLGVTLSLQPEYESTARVFVSADVGNEGSSEAYAASLFSQGRVESYAALATSRRLMQQVVLENDLELSPAQLARRITAEVEPDTVIIRVIARDPDPTRAQDIADTTATELARYVGELETPVDSDSPPVKATVVDPASFDPDPVSPVLTLNLGIAALLGLLSGIAIALAREVLDTSVKSADGAQDSLKAPILADVQEDDEVRHSPLISAGHGQSPRAEAFRVLRTNLQFLDLNTPPQTVVITSALQGEGKTTTAANLAIAAAQAGLKVLVLDADLRRPHVASTFNLVPTIGLTTTLVGTTKLAESIQRHPDTGVHVLASGPIPPNPSEILQSPETGKLLAELRNLFDLVIVDAPPLLPVADAAILAREADGAIVVVHYGRTKVTELVGARARLDAVGARTLGIVVNRSPQTGVLGYSYGSTGYAYAYAPTVPPSRRGRLRFWRS